MPIDPDTLRIPAYQRKTAIVSKAKQKLIMTALDRKEAGLPPGSKQPLAPRRPISKTPRRIERKIERQPVDLPVRPKKIKQIGETTHYLDKINVAIIMLSKGVKIGDILLIEGPDYVFSQPIEEMQIERKDVQRAKKGSYIGLKVAYEAEVDGKVYKI